MFESKLDFKGFLIQDIDVTDCCRLYEQCSYILVSTCRCVMYTFICGVNGVSRKNSAGHAIKNRKNTENSLWGKLGSVNQNIII